MRRLVLGCFWLFAGLTAASFAGALHGLGDSLAVFRHWWAGGLVASALILLIWPHRVLALIGIVAGGLAISSVAGPYLNGVRVTDPAYTLYQKNLLFHANSPNRIIRDMRAIDPDFLTLEEIAGENRALYWILAKEHAAALMCDFSRVGAVAVISRWPLVEGSQNCLGNRGAAAMKVVTPDGPVWLVAVHLHWPFPHEQAQQVRRLIADLDFLDAPVILAGDFNMVPWSHTLSALEAATGSQRAGGAVGTFGLFPPWVDLPIDHVLVPSGQGELTARPLLGSDHLGLLLRFNL